MTGTRTTGRGPICLGVVDLPARPGAATLLSGHCTPCHTRAGSAGVWSLRGPRGGRLTLQHGGTITRCEAGAPTPEGGRAMSHPVSRVTSSGGAASLLAVTGLIACKAARLFEASSYPWTPPSIFYTLREIARLALIRASTCDSAT